MRRQFLVGAFHGRAPCHVTLESTPGDTFATLGNKGDDMAKNEKSSEKLATLAGKVLSQKSSSATAKKLAGSVLTQVADKKPRSATPVKKTK